MGMDATFLRSCIEALESSVDAISKHGGAEDTCFKIYRAACAKEFELVLDQSGKLLRKRLAPYFASNLQVDRLHFKDLFRYAARHDLVSPEAVERWLGYRDLSNDTSRDHGDHFNEATLRLLPVFIGDARSLADMIEQANDG